jgi:alkanesulfonate monooxygenase SsuD/methylene tetrahydromethanopterin reductase-like flavin-dependent oxidoreductase (luciferase family)
MKLGLFVTTQWPAGTGLADQIRLLSDQVKAARDAGFESIWAGQHLLVGPMQMFQTVPLLARLMAVGEGMTFGPAVQLISMLNPVLVAEEAATLDWMSGGRYVLALGMGYRKEEFEATGVDQKQRVGRTLEAIEVMRKLWTGEPVTHHGKHFHLTDARISVKPSRPIPIWIGGSADKPVERAARIADAWVSSMAPPIGQLAHWLKLFRDTRAKAGLPPAGEYPISREVYVGGNRNSAFEEVRPYLDYKYSAYAQWGSSNVAGQLAKGIEDYARDRFIIGDAASVKDEIERYREALGLNHLICRMQWPGMSQEAVLASIARLGKAVRG